VYIAEDLCYYLFMLMKHSNRGERAMKIDTAVDAYTRDDIAEMSEAQIIAMDKFIKAWFTETWSSTDVEMKRQYAIGYYEDVAAWIDEVYYDQA